MVFPMGFVQFGRSFLSSKSQDPGPPTCSNAEIGSSDSAPQWPPHLAARYWSGPVCEWKSMEPLKCLWSIGPQPTSTAFRCLRWEPQKISKNTKGEVLKGLNLPVSSQNWIPHQAWRIIPKIYRSGSLSHPWAILEPSLSHPFVSSMSFWFHPAVFVRAVPSSISPQKRYAVFPRHRNGWGALLPVLLSNDGSLLCV